MGKGSDISKGKLASRPLRGAAAAGIAVGLAAASLVAPPNADATCIGIFGISINFGDGGHCSTSLFGFALGLGPDTFATAEGFFNAAIAVGSNITAEAGTGGALDFLNLAFNSGNATQGATSTVTAGGGGFNLAANLGGNANTGGGIGFSDVNISAGDGFGNVALNVVGNRNTIRAGDGSLDFAVNVGGSGGRGSDSRISATGSLSAAVQSQTVLGNQCTNANNPGCGNVVTANGPLSLVVAAGVVGKEVVQDGPGITLANSFNSDNFPNQTPPLANVLAASGTQGNRVGLNSTGNNTNGVAASGTQRNRFRPSLNAASNRSETTSTGGSVRTSVSEHVAKLAKKSSDPDSRGTGGPTRGANGAASTKGSDK